MKRNAPRGLFTTKAGHRFEECLKNGKVDIAKLRAISKPKN